VEWGQFLPDECWASLDTYNVSNTGDTPSIGTAPASGRVGHLSHDTPSLGSWWVCKQIQQAITVPNNTELSFDVKLGSPYSPVLAISVEPVGEWRGPGGSLPRR
jgi:hypothetical protein